MSEESCSIHPISLEEYLEIWKRCSAEHYDRIDYVMDRGLGCQLWDVEGKEYLDATSGYSAVNLGHHHPAIQEAVDRFFEEQGPFVVPNKVATGALIECLDVVTEYFGYDKFIPMNTGAEAVETAIKLALKWAYTVKNVPLNHALIIACPNNFHGRTRGNVSMSTHLKYKKHFGPYPDMVDWVPFGDVRALERCFSKLGHRVAAFIVEPIQGEAGIIVSPEGYLAEVNALCKGHNVLFIADEVQTALGRAGKNLVSEDVHPDIVVIGKSLGGGITPMSGILFDKALSVFKPGEHGSTYAGNAFASTIAVAVLDTIDRYNLCARSQVMGLYLKESLETALADNPHVAEIRGQGLMLAIAFEEGVNQHEMAMKCFEQRVVTIGSHAAIRICPPLTVDYDTCNEYVRRIARALES